MTAAATVSFLRAIPRTAPSMIPAAYVTAIARMSQRTNPALCVIQKTRLHTRSQTYLSFFGTNRQTRRIAGSIIMYKTDPNSIHRSLQLVYDDTDYSVASQFILYYNVSKIIFANDFHIWFRTYTGD